MKTFSIEITGKVQGVGFRPFILKLAKTMGLVGVVWNQGGRVFVEITCSLETKNQFVGAVKQQHPNQAKVNNLKCAEVPLKSFSEFAIAKSVSEKPGKMLFPTDLATCENCKTELFDVEDNRYQYAFVTCTNCGPRFSLMQALPYDRANTTMQKFVPCNSCKEEVLVATSNRCHSQTNSCPNCAVELSLYDSNGKFEELNQNQIIERCLAELEAGKTIAVKGVGGFLLMTDAANKKAVQQLRDRKNRPNKPFALLYPSLEMVYQDFLITQQEKELLEAKEAPIVLLTPKPELDIYSKVNSNFQKHGVMLPYAPLLWIISKQFKKPLIATSANLSGTPTIYKDRTAFENLFAFADFILTNNREITTPLDDSVIKLTPINQEQIILRRSRGYAPNLEVSDTLTQQENTIAFGGDLKATFTYADQNNVFTSQYLGNQEDLLSQYNYEDTLLNYLNLLQTEPQKVIIDAHPDYFSAYLGKMFSERYKIPIQKVQHHKAHFASVLAENNLFNKDVLGVIWDGTGYGEDGAIWGGEFFSYSSGSMDRLTHFEYFTHFAGNKFAKNTQLPAFSLFENYLSNNFWIEHFSDNNLETLKRLRLRSNEVLSSSVGRWFDAISFLLTGTNINTFEGEAAMRLEDLALSYVNQFGLPSDYYIFSVGLKRIKTESVKQHIINDVLKGVSKGKIAAKFHLALAALVRDVAVINQFNKVAISGGVFQNGLLVDLTLQTCTEAGIKVFRNVELPPNDENISLGQMAYSKFLKSSITTKKQKNVFGSTR